jgi:hypothetical protein
MALTDDEQKLLDFAKQSLPKWMFENDLPEEIGGAYAKMLELARSHTEEVFEQTFIENATNLPPDYLNQHAKDRGTSRQDGETDEALRFRLQNNPDAVTVAAILEKANAVLDIFGITDPAYIVELRRDKGFLLSLVSDTGTGGTFSGTVPNVIFTPTVPFARPPRTSWDITISSATSGGNNGTFNVTDVVTNGAKYSNASGVLGADGAAVWTIKKQDSLGNNLDGKNDAYFDRGHRFGNHASILIIILPYGTTADQALSVQEAVRQIKAAGVILRIERRLNP